MRAMDDGRFKCASLGFLVADEDKGRSMLFRQRNAMDENAERTMRCVAVVFRLLSEKTRQQRFGFRTRRLGQRSQRRAQKTGDVEARTRRERGRRNQLREKRKDREMPP